MFERGDCVIVHKNAYGAFYQEHRYPRIGRVVFTAFMDGGRRYAQVFFELEDKHYEFWVKDLDRCSEELYAWYLLGGCVDDLLTGC